MRIKISVLLTGIFLVVGVLVFASPPLPVSPQGQAPKLGQATPPKQPPGSRSIVPQTKQPVKAPPVQFTPPGGAAGKQPLSVTPSRGIDRHPVSKKGVEGYPVRGASPTQGAIRETPVRPGFAPGSTNAPVKGGVPQTTKQGSPSSTTTKTFERGVAHRTETATKPIDQKAGTTTKAISKPANTGTTTVTGTATTKTTGVASEAAAIPPPKGNPTLMIDSTAGPTHAYADGTTVFWPVGQKDGPKYIVKGKTGETHYFADGSTKTFSAKSGGASSAGAQNASLMTATKPVKGTETKSLIGADKQASSSAPKKTDILFFKEDPGATTGKQTPGISASKDSGLTPELKEALKQTGGKAIIEASGQKIVDSLQGKSSNDLKNVLDSFTSNLDNKTKSAKQIEMERQVAEKKAKFAEKWAKQEAAAKKAAGEKDTKISPTSDSQAEKPGSGKQPTKTAGTGQLTDSEVTAIGQGVRGALEGAGLNLINPSSGISANQPSTKTADTASKADTKTSKVVSQENKEKLTALEDRKKWLEGRTFSPTTHDNVPALEAKRQEELTKINAQIKELKAPAGELPVTKTATSTEAKAAGVRVNEGQGLATPAVATGGSPTAAETAANREAAAMLQKANTMLKSQIPGILNDANKQIADIEKSLKSPQYFNETTKAEALKNLKDLKTKRDQLIQVAKDMGIAGYGVAPVDVTAAPKASNAGAISSLQGQVSDIDKKLAVNKEGWKNVDPQDTSTKNALFKQEAELLATREQIRTQIHKLKAEDQAGTPSNTSGSSGAIPPPGTPSGGTNSAPKATGQSPSPQAGGRGVTMPPTDTSPPNTDSGLEPPPPPDFSGGDSKRAANNELIDRLTHQDDDYNTSEKNRLIETLREENRRLDREQARRQEEYDAELELHDFENAQRALTQQASAPSDPPSGEKSEDAFKVVRDLIDYGQQKIDKGKEFATVIGIATKQNEKEGDSPLDAMINAVKGWTREGMTKEERREAAKKDMEEKGGIAKEAAEKAKQGTDSSKSETPGPSSSDFGGFDTPVDKTTPTAPKDTGPRKTFDDF